MKSLTAVQTGGASMPAIKANGRVARHPPHRGDGENAEMKMYLSKLKDLVPFMPKNRKLSKLEIIQHVIDYICDLQTELETHPEIGNFDAAAALQMVPTLRGSEEEDGDDADMDEEDNEEMLAAERLSPQQQQQQQQQQQNISSPATRQPLVDRQAPNTILPSNNSSATVMHTSAINTAASQQVPQQQQQHQQQLINSQVQMPLTEKDNSNRPQPC